MKQEGETKPEESLFFFLLYGTVNSDPEPMSATEATS